MIFEKSWMPGKVLEEQKEVTITPINKNVLEEDPGNNGLIRLTSDGAGDWEKPA